MENHLYYGDNLDVLQRYITAESVDLVYLDPPFKSDRDYNVLFKERNGRSARAQIKAFSDTWQWDQGSAEAFEEVVEAGGRTSDVMRAFHEYLGNNDMMAYLAMMAPRLKDLHRVLKETGSIYLHCDPTASHYLKILMDAVFDPLNFQNEIIWRRHGSHSPPRSYGPIHDTILFYSKSKDYYFQALKRPYMRGHVENRYKRDKRGYKFITGGNILTGAGIRDGESGKPWRGFDPSAKGRHWAVPGYLTGQMEAEFAELGVLAKMEALYRAGLIEIKKGAEWPHPVKYLGPDDGLPLTDIWASQPYTEKTVFGTEEGIDHDVMWMGTTDPERLGYQTQKPLGLLERIIESSCPPDGVVLDPFCGCGTTVVASQDLNRTWIGIDITHLAMSLIKHRLQDAFGDDVEYEVTGEPVTLVDARTLAKEDKFQFQWWALGLVGARPIELKKGADMGIDGRLFFHDEVGGSKSKKIIISVKSGKVGVGDVRDLVGVITRENAEQGVLITLQPPTRPMIREAADGGTYYSPMWDEKYPKIQILTIEELLQGARLKSPQYKRAELLRRARSVERQRGLQVTLASDRFDIDDL